MLDKYFHCEHTRERLRNSPIHDEIELLATRLDARGHSETVVQAYVAAVEHFGFWASRENNDSVTIDIPTVRRFLEIHLPECHCPPPASRTTITLRAALNHLLVAVTDKNPSAVPNTSEKEILINEYIDHLRINSGLSAATLNYRARYAREFLDDQPRLGEATPADVMRFVADYGIRCKRSSAQVAACSLRSFLRFLHMRGLCDVRLERAVPRIPQWKREGLPKSLTERDIRALVNSFDRSCPTGRRDYAMTLCMTELGMRVSEVTAIELENINWRNGIIIIRSPKGGRSRSLPLTKQLGEAIAAYLKSGRVTSVTRRLFLRHRAPLDEPVGPALVRGVIRRAYERAGLPPEQTGTHILRHSTATRLYQRGASLKDIADLLGHLSIDTSAIYTKVNIPLLAAVALPWPEEQ